MKNLKSYNIKQLKHKNFYNQYIFKYNNENIYLPNHLLDKHKIKTNKDLAKVLFEAGRISVKSQILETLGAKKGPGND